MSAQHTPGPWKVEQQPGDEWWFGGRNGCQYVIYSGDKWYNSHAVLGGEYGEEEPAANARLIAAAPDLLEALEEAEKHFGPFADITINGQHDPDDLRVLALIRAAIARAKGTNHDRD